MQVKDETSAAQGYVQGPLFIQRLLLAKGHPALPQRLCIRLQRRRYARFGPPPQFLIPLCSLLRLQQWVRGWPSGLLFSWPL